MTRFIVLFIALVSGPAQAESVLLPSGMAFDMCASESFPDVLDVATLQDVYWVDTRIGAQKIKTLHIGWEGDVSGSKFDRFIRYLYEMPPEEYREEIERLVLAGRRQPFTFYPNEQAAIEALKEHSAAVVYYQQSTLCEEEDGDVKKVHLVPSGVYDDRRDASSD